MPVRARKRGQERWIHRDRGLVVGHVLPEDVDHQPPVAQVDEAEVVDVVGGATRTVAIVWVQAENEYWIARRPWRGIVATRRAGRRSPSSTRAKKSSPADGHGRDSLNDFRVEQTPRR